MAKHHGATEMQRKQFLAGQISGKFGNSSTSMDGADFREAVGDKGKMLYSILAEQANRTCISPDSISVSF